MQLEFTFKSVNHPSVFLSGWWFSTSLKKNNQPTNHLTILGGMKQILKTTNQFLCHEFHRSLQHTRDMGRSNPRRLRSILDQLITIPIPSVPFYLTSGFSPDPMGTINHPNKFKQFWDHSICKSPNKFMAPYERLGNQIKHRLPINCSSNLPRMDGPIPKATTRICVAGT